MLDLNDNFDSTTGEIMLVLPFPISALICFFDSNM